MTQKQLELIYKFIIYKFDNVYEYRKFLVANAGIEDVENNLNFVKFRKTKISRGFKNSSLETGACFCIITHFLETPYVHTLNNFIEVEMFKDLFLKDIV